MLKPKTHEPKSNIIIQGSPHHTQSIKEQIAAAAIRVSSSIHACSSSDSSHKCHHLNSESSFLSDNNALNTAEKSKQNRDMQP
ncbi:hypothetical protein ACSS6W_010203 [Trichoderma asperelloides]